MKVERTLQIGMAALAALGTLMLGMGERNSTLPVLAVIVSASSVYLTDVRGWLNLRGRLGDLLGLAALLYTAWELFHAAAEAQLLAVANLMVYLQFILQYQQKSVRTYWLLALISLMQAAVSTALNLELRYGVLLVAYAFVGMTTIALLVVHRERLRFESGRLAPLAAAQARIVPPRRWPLADLQPVFGSRLVGDATAETIDWRFFWHLSRMGLLSLLAGAALFLCIPRQGRTEWRPQAGFEQHETGFTERVELGSLGEIIESPASVMRVRFTHYPSQEVYQIHDELLLRGVLLNYYQDGSWQLEQTTDSERWNNPSLGRELVQQEITLEPSETEVAFSVYPIAEIIDRDLIEFDRSNRRLIRTDKQELGSRVTYRVITAGLLGGYQLKCVPEPQYQNRFELLQMPTRNGEDPLPGLRRIAGEVLAESGLTGEQSRYRKSKALERYFRASTEFTYSLAPKRANPQLDPIEDFLVNTHQGHCEYYASALVLMLRSAGIPARMVVGYKGGDWNDLGGYLLVRRLHAHAWVEAYVPTGEIPKDVQAGQVLGSGSWILLDPTPGAGTGELTGYAKAYWPLLQQMSDYAQFLWSHYVMGMDADRQQEAIYLPLMNAWSWAIKAVQDRGTWEAIYVACVGFPRALREEIANGHYFNWRLILLLFVAPILLIVGAWLGRKALRRAQHWWRRAALAVRRDDRVAVDFYRRLEQLLARYRWERSPAETQREFALQVGRQLDAAGLASDIARVPRQVAETFYRVRFGQRSLDRIEVEAVENALAELDRALAAAPPLVR
ncbi:MAG: DUF3488 and transglutaminase-like domain-containing protein [Pirellulales bacterium]|nr:DUF3488 and transglutaminase-like domain-containing protein [Pirellulales bacterium]